MKYFTSIVIFFFILSSCDFKRFGQEKYTCNSNNLSINSINVIKTNSIKKVYVTISGTEYNGVIQNFNKDEIQISINAALIKINKNKKEIVATFKENIYFLDCEVEYFKI